MEPWVWGGPKLKGGPGRGFQGLPEQGAQPVATFCVQEKSHIEVYVRPLADEASALVFFSRRADMPYRYHSSLARLNFNSSNTYEVSILLPVGLRASPGGCRWGWSSGRSARGSCRHRGLWLVPFRAPTSVGHAGDPPQAGQSPGFHTL